MPSQIKNAIKAISNVHRPNGAPNVFLFSTPRSGSTWLMELIGSQPGFKYCNEPLNLRKPLIRKHLGVTEWQDLFGPDAREKLFTYFQAICAGQISFLNQSPLGQNYRPITRRIVFKIIHGGEDHINWFRDSFNGRVAYLARHPIAVSLSREVYPRLEAFLNSNYSRHFTDDQLRRARRIADFGSHLERGVLSWCFENAVPLRDASDDWAILSYEQLVQDPYPIIDYLADRLELPERTRIMRRLSVPSSSHKKSDSATQTILRQGAEKRSMLLEKWRKHIAGSDARRAMEILRWFNLDLYDSEDILPKKWIWTDAPITGPSLPKVASTAEEH